MINNWNKILKGDDLYHKKPVSRLIKKEFHQADDPLASCQSLEELKALVEAFEACDLKKAAQNTVFGEGNPKASVVALGEAPGAKEDEEGRPFCGQSGQLLDKALAAINLTREKNLYITNSVFWRPPANRKPTPEELALCRPFLEKHLALINPKLILLVGATALEALLGITSPITKLRGQYFDYYNPYLNQAITATPIFHPSYLLRQPAHKKTLWFDLLKIKKDCSL
jgi:uracil-DNA glycosylase family 4